MNRTYLRGDMYYADLGQGVGSEQEGYRPVLRQYRTEKSARYRQV